MPTTVEAVVKEGSYAYLQFQVKDASGNPVTPVSATYSVHDVYSGTELRADTSLTPSSSNLVTLTDDDNVILDTENRFERRRVTVKSTLAGGGKKNESYEYTVQNLHHHEVT